MTALKKNLLYPVLIFVFIVVFSVSASALNGKEDDMRMKISSPEFKNSASIPSKFTCEGEDINPQLVIENIPSGAKSLALIVDDPDAPAKVWVHWVVYDIDPSMTTIRENSIPGRQGSNDSSSNGSYGGPCPPSGTHRYYFKLYALDKVLGLREGVTKRELEKAMEGHILDKSELVGLYKRGK